MVRLLINAAFTLAWVLSAVLAAGADNPTGPYIVLASGIRLYISVMPDDAYTIWAITAPVKTGTKDGVVFLPVTGTTVRRSLIQFNAPLRTVGAGATVGFVYLDPFAKRPITNAAALKEMSADLRNAVEKAIQSAVEKKTVPKPPEGRLADLSITSGRYFPGEP